jgi:hypothetical protein
VECDEGLIPGISSAKPEYSFSYSWIIIISGGGYATLPAFLPFYLDYKKSPTLDHPGIGTATI